MASLVEERKEAKYAHLNTMHFFSPVDIEISGVWPKTLWFVRELGQQQEHVMGELRSTNFHIQRLLVAWQFSISAELPPNKQTKTHSET